MMSTDNEIKKPTLSKKEIQRELWYRGILSFKCHPIQKEMYDIFYNSPERSRLVWVLARQSGKTWLLCVLALEQAIRHPNSVIKIVTDTKLHAENILLPKFQEVMIDCPQELKPEYRVKQSTFYFTNGSQIQLAGTDNKHYEKLRGIKSHLNLIDESGFCNYLEDVVDSVLFPTTTHTGGRTVLASTIPEQLDHQFFKYIEKAKFKKTLTEKTIYDNPLLTPEKIQETINEMEPERFRREYLNEIVKDSNTSVIPEFNGELKVEIVKEWIRPPFYDNYVAMDLGGKDLTAVLFGYYDFRHAKLIIEDEIIMDFRKPDNNLEKLTKQIMDKENELWLDPQINELKRPSARVSDINPIAIGEILKYSFNKLFFATAKKDDKDSALNHMRSLLSARQIIIHPRCKTLILHLENVRWSSPTNKDKFARSPDHGHYDAVDALKYLVRAVNFNKNPYPAHYGVDRQDLFVPNTKKFNQTDINAIYEQIFNIKRKK